MDSGLYRGSSGKRAYQDYDDEAGERNGRQKKRSASANEPAAPMEDTEYRILCPSSRIGSLIGKGGAIIKALRLECRSKIKVEFPVPGSEERVVLIGSSSDQVKEHSYYVCNAQEALFKVRARITEAEDDDEPPQPVTVRLLVPKSHIGCLLGKGGKIIEQMREEIGAQIRILPKDQHPPSAGSKDELVQVTGDSALVKKALFDISTRLHENITGERIQKGAYMPEGPGNMMPSMHAGGGMYPPMGYMSQTGSLLGPASVGGPMQGLGYTYGDTYGDTGLGNAWSLVTGLSMPTMSAGGVPCSDGVSEEEFTIRVLCPNTRIGSIIGKGGNVIKKLREETGVKIKVEEQVSDCDERIVLMSAAEYADTYPSPVIEAVLQVFGRLVELQMDKDVDNKSFFVRLLVPSSQIGCLLGKGGSIVSEMRRVTKANIRISPKDEPSKCAEENDELVQIMGDQTVTRDALLQVLNRLRSNLFKGQEGRDAGPGLGASILPVSVAGYGSSMLSSVRGASDSAYTGTLYPLTNVGYPGMDYRYGGYGTGLTGLSSQPSSGREGKGSRRRQR